MKTQIDYSKIAQYYDTYVQVSFDIPFFINEAGKVSGEVLELMAGTGRVSVPLIEAGTQLTCVDYSQEMLNVLRDKLVERGLSADLQQMDIRELNLHKQFELAIIPFHSFAELLTLDDQQQALTAIYVHLATGGTLLCTLHNPAVRRKNVDGRLRLWQKIDLQNPQGTLLMFGVERYTQDEGVVNGLQIFEHYDANGVMQAKQLMETRFNLIEKSQFEELALAAGYEIVGLYGDYSYGDFDQALSTHMVWRLEK